MVKFISNWFPVIALSLFILFLSSEKIESPVEFKYIDLVAHFFFYAVYAFFLGRALGINTRTGKPHLIIIAIAVATLYGALMEFIQHFIPYRNSSLADGLANFVGAVCGTYLFYLGGCWRRRRS